MKLRADIQGRKAEDKVLPGGRCRRCPFCASSGQCLDGVIKKSGRCGDWVWYVRGNKQCRRRWAKPRDPRTPEQLEWRARLGAASRKYSQGLSPEQRDACIAAGAKRRSRPRLAQSGPLTGQQHWVGRECQAKAEGRRQKAETAAKGLQAHGITRSTGAAEGGNSGLPGGQGRRGIGSTWEQCRSGAVAVPWQGRRRTVRSGQRVRILGGRRRCWAWASYRNGRWRELWRGS